MSLYSETIGEGPRVVLVHGFTQNGRCWGPLADWLAEEFEVVLVDAPGHGFSGHDDADLETAAQLLLEVGGTASYIGYSMGARMLLHAALQDAEQSGRPQMEELVLIGATGGLDSADERSERRSADETLALSLEADGTAAFLDRWLAMPMFAGLDEEEQALSFRLGNRSEGLASSLRSCGTGTQEPLWDKLSALTLPVSVVVGSEDDKFNPLADRLVEAIGDSADKVTLPGGHAVHLEAADAFLEFFFDDDGDDAEDSDDAGYE